MNIIFDIQLYVIYVDCIIGLMKAFHITSARDIQRNYRRLFDQVKTTRKPLYVMKGTEVEVVVVDPQSYEEMQSSSSAESQTNSHIARVPWRKF